MSRATNTIAISPGKVMCLDVIATKTTPAALPLVLEGINDVFAQTVLAWAHALSLHCEDLGARLVLVTVPAECYERVVSELEQAPWWAELYVATAQTERIPRIIHGPHHAAVTAHRLNPMGTNVPLAEFAPARASRFGKGRRCSLT